MSNLCKLGFSIVEHEPFWIYFCRTGTNLGAAIWFPYVGSVMGPHDMYYHFAQLDLSSRKQFDATMSAHYEFGGTEQTLKYGYPQRRRDLSTGKSSPVKQRER